LLFVEPAAQVDQSATFGAEGERRGVGLVKLLFAGGAMHAQSFFLLVDPLDELLEVELEVEDDEVDWLFDFSFLPSLFADSCDFFSFSTPFL